MALTFSTQAAYTWDTENSASLQNVYDQLMDAHPLARPTLRILMNHKAAPMTLGPNAKFQIPIIVKHYSPSVAQQNYRFQMDDIDNVTMQDWSPIALANGAGTNDVQMKRYGSNKARFDHVDLKVESVHRGTTEALNYLLWYNWDSTVIGGDKSININTQLTTLTNPPEELYVKNITQVNELPYSIPMLARKVVNGYTLGNIAVTTSTNQYWHPVNTDASGASITRAASGLNVDSVTAIDANTCKELTMDDINEHLDAVTEGRQYTLYAACPPALYRQLRNIVLAQNIRNDDSPLADLGIRSSITVNEYDVVFYQEPVMRALWPNSIFFFDPTAIYIQPETSFDPMVYPWERIPGTNMYGTAVYFSFNIVRPDAQGVSAMHGYKAS